MNKQKVQKEITDIINAYRKANPRFANKQYPAAKWQIQKLADMGVIEFMPNAPYQKNIGYAEADLVLKALQDKGSAVFNAYGEGEDIPPSALNKAMREIEPSTEEIVDEADDNETDTADDELQALIERVAVAEQQRQLEEDAVIAEKELALSIERLRLLTIEETAQKKNCHPETVRRAARDGAFPGARKVGAGVWLLPAPEVAAWQPLPVGRPAASPEAESRRRILLERRANDPGVLWVDGNDLVHFEGENSLPGTLTRRGRSAQWRGGQQAALEIIRASWGDDAPAMEALIASAPEWAHINRGFTGIRININGSVPRTEGLRRWAAGVRPPSGWTKKWTQSAGGGKGCLTLSRH